MSLNNGTLLPNSPDGPISVSDSNVTVAAEPLWVLTTFDLPTPAQIYCGVVRRSPMHKRFVLTLSTGRH